MTQSFGGRLVEWVVRQPRVSTKPSAVHFGRDVHLCNIRLEEILRVEIYRRGLHSDAFEHENLRPRLSEVPPVAHAHD
jgi:phosphosulfolactate synthase (CoM biosynthesis protein A)